MSIKLYRIEASKHAPATIYAAHKGILEWKFSSLDAKPYAELR